MAVRNKKTFLLICFGNLLFRLNLFVRCKGGECSDAALSPFVSPSTATVTVRAVLQFVNATDEQRSRFE